MASTISPLWRAAVISSVCSKSKTYTIRIPITAPTIIVPRSIDMRSSTSVKPCVFEELSIVFGCRMRKRTHHPCERDILFSHTLRNGNCNFYRFLIRTCSIWSNIEACYITVGKSHEGNIGTVSNIIKIKCFYCVQDLSSIKGCIFFFYGHGHELVVQCRNLYQAEKSNSQKNKTY